MIPALTRLASKSYALRINQPVISRLYSRIRSTAQQALSHQEVVEIINKTGIDSWIKSAVEGSVAW